MQILSNICSSTSQAVVQKLAVALQGAQTSERVLGQRFSRETKFLQQIRGLAYLSVS